jgi:hypothetical protein
VLRPQASEQPHALAIRPRLGWATHTYWFRPHTRKFLCRLRCLSMGGSSASADDDCHTGTVFAVPVGIVRVSRGAARWTAAASTCAAVGSGAATSSSAQLLSVSASRRRRVALRLVDVVRREGSRPGSASDGRGVWPVCSSGSYYFGNLKSQTALRSANEQSTVFCRPACNVAQRGIMCRQQAKCRRSR